MIVSNKWVLVIEVKLQSNFGDKQPWREYIVGCKIAQDHSILVDSVYYLVLARKRLDIAATFKPDEAEQLDELAARTNYIEWHEAVSLIGSWLREASAEHSLLAEHERMLTDLFKAMRRRRAIAFSGFTFANIASTAITANILFCPPRFTGFQYQAPEAQPAKDTIFLSSCHAGFVGRYPEVDLPQQPVFLRHRFDGFVRNSHTVIRPYDTMFLTSRFTGFLETAATCRKYEHVFRMGLSK
ncbi:hypothetical protein ACFL5Z_08475 [Planctomycetota bacterium]